MKKIQAFLGMLVLLSSTLPIYAGGRQEGEEGITIWTKYNALNPENIRDEWLKKTLEEYQAETGKVVENIFVPYDQINNKLNVAVTAGGQVPEISYVDSQQQAFYITNDTLMDLTDYVKDASWYKDLSPRALAACTAPDGRILCVPLNIGTRVSYVWADAWPNGFPGTTTEFLKEAERIKAEGHYAITFKASEKYGAEGLYYGLIKSYGGRYGDGKGQAGWASPETATAVEFLRTLFKNGYAPEIDLAPGFDNERPFMQGDAVSFAGISWSYVYMNPLTAPDGTIFDNGAQSVAKAVEAGKIIVAPYLSAPNGEPVAAITCSALAIPQGAEHIAEAKAFIDWLMTTERNAECAEAIGGLPSLRPAMDTPTFKNAYWQQVAKITESYGAPYPALAEYDRALTKLAQTFEALLANPNLDSMERLKQAQEEVNR
ncbi:ABC transporter substrate-binding protein [Sediminispirochaeta bajacaliforniensis]|uniref:ABC transporter substrate-binding protein n=1 Tax=Sediminispirochaeta bajacaliforniensis TaxID=148 RepID=UPI00037B8B53|nr:extracellular solute-binding protein [Sediminispirochaeta bajacaliforniensis]